MIWMKIQREEMVDLVQLVFNINILYYLMHYIIIFYNIMKIKNQLLMLLLVLLLFFLYIQPNIIIFLFTNIISILLFIIIIIIIGFYNSSFSFGLLMIFIIFIITINTSKEGYQSITWSKELIEKFIEYQYYHNPIYIFDMNIIQKQVSPKEAENYFKNGKWIWSPEIEEMYKYAILTNPNINYNQLSSLE